MRGLDSINKYAVLRIFSTFLSPLAFLGFLIKLPGLATSKQERARIFIDFVHAMTKERGASLL